MGCGASGSQEKYRKAAEIESKKEAEGAEASVATPKAARYSVDGTNTKSIAAVFVKGRFTKDYDVDDREMLKRKQFCLVTNKGTQKVRACRKLDKKRVDPAEVEEQVAILGLLDHPNILQLYEVYQDKMHYYLMQEHCRGGKLIDRLTSQTPTFDSFLINPYWDEHAWNPDVYCGRHKAEERAQWLVSTQGISVAIARQNVMYEFADMFPKGGADGAKRDSLYGTNLSLNEPLVAIMMKQVLMGLSYLHLSCVCHRNLDFQRLMVLEPIGGGKGGVPLHKATVKIWDFDIACRFEPGVPMTQVVSTDAVCFPAMAPELLRRAAYTELCDEWSCGAFAYQLLSGEMPFGDYHPDDVLEHICTKGLKFGADSWKKVSAGAKELVRGLLENSPKERFTAQHALTCHWIKESETMAGQAYRDAGNNAKGCDANEIVRKLKAFNERGKLEKKALQVIAHRLQDDEIRDLGKVFLALDANGDGVVTIKELKIGMEKMQGKFDGVAGLKDLLEWMGQNEHQFIEYTEFLAAVMDEKYYQQESLCWVAFKYFDKDGDEKISRKELLDALTREDLENMDPAYTQLKKGVVQSMNKFDVAGDQCIDFAEFTRMMHLNGGCSTDETQVQRKTAKKLTMTKNKARGKSGCEKCGEVRTLRTNERTGLKLCTACCLLAM